MGLDAENLAGSAKRDALAALAPEEVIQRMAARRCERHMRDTVLSQLPDWKTIRSATSPTIDLHVPSAYADEVAGFRRLLAGHDFDALVARYPLRETRAFGAITKALKCASIRDYEQMVVVRTAKTTRWRPPSPIVSAHWQRRSPPARPGRRTASVGSSGVDLVSDASANPARPGELWVAPPLHRISCRGRTAGPDPGAAAVMREMPQPPLAASTTGHLLSYNTRPSKPRLAPTTLRSSGYLGRPFWVRSCGHSPCIAIDSSLRLSCHLPPKG